MLQIDAHGSTIESIQQKMGEALAAHIRKMGTITAFARKSGILRQTLYRLLGGETVGTDVLLRALRTLGRHAEIDTLLELPHETPIEKADKPLQRRTVKSGPALSKLKTAKPESP